MPQKARAGDPWEPSASVNNMVIEVDRQIQRLLSAYRSRRPHGAMTANVIPVRNDTGENANRYSVIGLDIANTIINPDDDLASFHNGPVLKGILSQYARVSTSSENAVSDRIAIYLEPVADGEIGLAMIDGIAPVYMHLLSQSHYYAMGRYGLPIGGPFYAQSAYGGNMRILWRPTDAGSYEWVIVRLGAWSSPRWIGTADEAFTGGTSSFYATAASAISGIVPSGSLQVENTFGLTGAQYDPVHVGFHPGNSSTGFGPFWVLYNV